MKKILAMATAIILATGTTAFAADKKNDQPVHNQKANYQLSFTRLEVENDIDIILVESQETSMEFSGTEADIAKLDWKIKDGVLHIKSKKGSLKNKVKLTINVSQLKEIAIKGASEVKSDGLNSAALQISLNGNCSVSIRNTGGITVINENDTDIDVRRVSGDVKFG